LLQCRLADARRRLTPSRGTLGPHRNVGPLTLDRFYAIRFRPAISFGNECFAREFASISNAADTNIRSAIFHLSQRMSGSSHIKLNGETISW